MCCFDKDKCKPQPSAAPCQAGTHRRLEVQTPRVGKQAGQAAAGRGRGDEGVPADSQAGEGCRAGKGTETLHVDHEDAGFFRCCFSSSGKVPKGDKGQQGVEGPSLSLFSGLSPDDQFPGFVAGLSNQQSPYCPEKYRLRAFSCCPGTGRAQGDERAQSGAARGPRTMPGELLFQWQCQEPSPLTAACSRGAHPAVLQLRGLLQEP